MAETNLKQIAQNVIPDDPEASAYRFIIVAAKRARQLQNGARSFLPTTSKKPTVMAMEEVRRGLVQYEDIAIHHGRERGGRRRIGAPEQPLDDPAGSPAVTTHGPVTTKPLPWELAEASPHTRRRSWPATLMERGFSVQVVMTRSAEEFVRPLTFAALTGRKVLTSLFSGERLFGASRRHESPPRIRTIRFRARSSISAWRRRIRSW